MLGQIAHDPGDPFLQQIAQFEKEGKLLGAQRIRMRTEYDLEMMAEMGFCQGIENHSRHVLRQR